MNRSGSRPRGVRRALAVALAGLAAMTLGGASSAGEAANTPDKWVVPGEVLVRFDDGLAAERIGATHDALGTEVVKSFQIVPNLQLVKLAPGQTVDEAVARYEGLAGVSYAQPNLRYYVDAVPNDPLYPSMYNLDNTGQTGGTPDADIDAPEAWNIATGRLGIAVGDIDTGIDYNHPDLAAHAKPNRAECNGVAGMDDEGNGYVDDCHGIDTINGDTDPMDGNQHGTHTAGTIGAIGNNGVGVTGVNWKVTIVACKSHDDVAGGGTSASIIECFQYMEIMKTLGVNVIATNNSYGGCPEACAYDQATYDAIKSNMLKGIITVASAGNDNLDNDEADKYPVSYYLPNVIGVASTTHTDAKSSFSNFGDRSVHVGAPGSTIRSTVPGGGYAFLSGTSMAGPHVAGLAALLKSSSNKLKWKQIRNLILAGGDPKPGLATNTITGRRINAFGSLTCSNVSVSNPLRPLDTARFNSPTVQSITVAILNIVCGQPSTQALTVTITPGGTVLSLKDSGVGADLSRKDGIFSALWSPSPCTPGSYTFTFSNGKVITSNVTCSP